LSSTLLILTPLYVTQEQNRITVFTEAMCDGESFFIVNVMGTFLAVANFCMYFREFQKDNKITQTHEIQTKLVKYQVLPHRPDDGGSKHL
jgi:hypothetical protein